MQVKIEIVSLYLCSPAKNFFVQNKLIVEYVDLVIFFTEDEKITKVKDLKRLVEKQKKSLILKS